jgi:signal transduction histidine kinase
LSGSAKIGGPAPGGTAPGPRQGIRAGLVALARALAFFGLMVTGSVLLILLVAPGVLTALGLGHLLQALLHADRSGVSRNDLIAAVCGLAGLWFVLPAALLGTRRLAKLTRRLAARWCGVIVHEAYRPVPAGTRQARPNGTGRLGYLGRMRWLLNDAATWRDLLWLAVNAVTGSLILLVPLLLFGSGIVAFIIPALGSLAWFNGLQHLVPPPAFPGNTPLVLFIIGLAMAVAGAWIAPPLLRGYAGIARWVLAPSAQAELQLRVAHLARTRSETLDTGAAELRRIERDLHDGAQARLVAMGLTLDAAGRLLDTDPAAARALLYEARDASARALVELRDLVRGIHPPVLADRGLGAAVRAIALDSPLRVLVTGTLPGRPPAPVESAAYFAVSELLANVVKHSGVRAADVDLRHESGALRIMVRDEGTGGADPSRGTGLRGIERRLAAFDGVLVVTSPAGGPTEAILDVPCALS